MSDSNKFRSLRLSHAWSQEQLAELCGLSVRTVQRVENGDHPSLETLSALAAVFEVSVADLSGPDALDQRIAEAKSKIAEEGRFYRSVITAVVVCALLVIRGMRIFVFRGLSSHWQQKRLRQILRR